MFAHGYQKVFEFGPAMFGKSLAQLDVPAPIFMGYVVSFTELVGGALLIVGLLSRLAALALTVNLVVAILLVLLHAPLIPAQAGVAARKPRWR